MKTYLYIILIILFSSCKSKLSSIDNYLFENNLKGEIIEFSSNEGIVEEFKSKTDFKLNSEGNLIEERDENSLIEIIYNKNVRVISYTNLQEKLFLYKIKIETTYNDDYIEEKHYTQNKLLSKIKKIFDPKNRIISIEETDEETDESRQKKETYKYIENNIIETYYYYDNLKSDCKRVQTLDDKGNVIYEIHMTLDGKRYPRTPETRFEYEYDDKGNWIKRLWFEDNKLFVEDKRSFVYK